MHIRPMNVLMESEWKIIGRCVQDVRFGSLPFFQHFSEPKNTKKQMMVVFTELIPS